MLLSSSWFQFFFITGYSFLCEEINHCNNPLSLAVNKSSLLLDCLQLLCAFLWGYPRLWSKNILRSPGPKLPNHEIPGAQHLRLAHTKGTSPCVNWPFLLLVAGPCSQSLLGDKLQGLIPLCVLTLRLI